MELGITDNVRFIVYQDNKSTLHLAFNGEGFNGKAKHFRVRYHFIKEMIDSFELDLQWCPTSEMLADFLTKALPYEDFVRLTSAAMASA